MNKRTGDRTMELTKQDTQKAKGVAIIGMVMLHLFCRLDDLPYVPWIWIRGTPFVYYLGLFGDICVPIYCFCSGYAHYLLKEKHGKNYSKSILIKLFRFLINYWIVVVLFSAVGLFFENGSVIPGSFSEFLGNIFLYRISYNGAWWFVVTYIFLSVLSPLLIQITNFLHPILLVALSGMVYFVAYLFRFEFILTLKNEAISWFWQQLILIGTSQFGYMVGMVCRKEAWITKLRRVFSGKTLSRICFGRGKQVVLCLLPVLTFIGHCIVQSMIVAPITAASVLICLFVVSLPNWLNRFFLFMGKHSTNIWLTHMFFYLILFEDLVFAVKYPVLILLLTMVFCLAVSAVIKLMTNSCLRYLKFLDRKKDPESITR